MKDIFLEGAATETISGLSRQATILIHYYPPHTIVQKSPFELKYNYGTWSNAFYWTPVSNSKRMMPGEAPVQLDIDRTMIVEKSFGIINGIFSGIEVGYSWNGIGAAYRSDYSTNYEETASHAFQGGTGMSKTIFAKDLPVEYRWGMNHRWRQSESVCAAYGLDGYQNDFVVVARKWYDDSRFKSEVEGAIFDTGWDYLPNLPGS